MIWIIFFLGLGIYIIKDCRKEKDGTIWAISIVYLILSTGICISLNSYFATPDAIDTEYQYTTSRFEIVKSGKKMKGDSEETYVVKDIDSNKYKVIDVQRITDYVVIDGSKKYLISRERDYRYKYDTSKWNKLMSIKYSTDKYSEWEDDNTFIEYHIELPQDEINKLKL